MINETDHSKRALPFSNQRRCASYENSRLGFQNISRRDINTNSVDRFCVGTYVAYRYFKLQYDVGWVNGSRNVNSRIETTCPKWLKFSQCGFPKNGRPFVLRERVRSVSNNSTAKPGTGKAGHVLGESYS